MSKEISIYHEYEYFSELDRVSDNIKPLDLEKSKGLKSYVLMILYTIYKYRCLNKTSLDVCINLKNKSRWKTNSLKKVLQQLRKEQYVGAFGTSREPTKENYEVVIYVLKKKGFLLLQDTYKNLDKDKVYDLKEVTANTLLKQASISQYHIHLIKNYGYMLNSSKFDRYKTATGELIPSMISFTRYGSYLDLVSKREKMTLFGIVAPRKEEELEDFLGFLLRLINAEVETIDCLKIIMVVCENNTHASWIAWNINKYRQVRPFPVLYIQDMVTACEDPLTQVLSCETDEEGIVKSNINFLKN